MEAKKVLFYDIKSYDKELFKRFGKDYNLEMKFLKGILNEESADLSKGYEIVCAFANDTINKEVIDILAENGFGRRRRTRRLLSFSSRRHDGYAGVSG